MNTMHLFAGIGGGILADLILGHTPIVAVEWDKYACKVLRERVTDGWFNGMSVWEGDVRMFDPSEYAGRVDCIHAGFPCQDISVAGKQAGLGEGTRSGLYREVLRIAGVVRPRYLFLENVSAILSNGLGTVLGDLATMGYDCRWLCIKASDVGAPHGRDRWFALAELGNTEHDGQPPAEVSKSITEGNGDNETRTQPTSEPTRPGEQYEELADTNESGFKKLDIPTKSNESKFISREFNENIPYTENERYVQRSHEIKCEWNPSRCSKREFKGGCETMANPTGIGQQGSRPHEQSVDYSAAGDWEADRVVNCGEAGQSDGQLESCLGGVAYEFPADMVSGWWEVEPNVGRVTDVTKDRAAQLKGLGNAQVPLQAAVAWRLLTK